MYSRIDASLTHYENILSQGAAIPIVGTVPAAIKIMLGTVEVIAGLAASIFAFLEALFTGDFKKFEYFCSHIKRGIANIGIGMIEMIPIAGTGMYLARRSMELSTPLLPSSTEIKQEGIPSN